MAKSATSIKLKKNWPEFNFTFQFILRRFIHFFKICILLGFVVILACFSSNVIFCLRLHVILTVACLSNRRFCFPSFHFWLVVMLVVKFLLTVDLIVLHFCSLLLQTLFFHTFSFSCSDSLMFLNNFPWRYRCSKKTIFELFPDNYNFTLIALLCNSVTTRHFPAHMLLEYRNYAMT